MTDKTNEDDQGENRLRLQLSVNKTDGSLIKLPLLSITASYYFLKDGPWSI